MWATSYDRSLWEYKGLSVLAKAKHSRQLWGIGCGYHSLTFPSAQSCSSLNQPGRPLWAVPSGYNAFCPHRELNSFMSSSLCSKPMISISLAVPNQPNPVDYLPHQHTDPPIPLFFFPIYLSLSNMPHHLVTYLLYFYFLSPLVGCNVPAARGQGSWFCALTHPTHLQ